MGTRCHRRLVALICGVAIWAATGVAQKGNGAVVASSAPAPPSIVSISVCSPTGGNGAGSCPSGTFDTLQAVQGPDGSWLNNSSLGVNAVPDEHSSVFAPGALGANREYLFYLATTLEGNPGIGVSVLSGGTGPNQNGQWKLGLPTTDGYGSYPGGFGQVFAPAMKDSLCPTVSDGNPAHQDQTFDMNYAASGSIVKDPTGSPGSFLMIYEGTNSCIGNAGGPKISTDDSYISLAIATSLDYGKTWPTYRGTATFPFDPLPGANATKGPNAPMGALGGNVCMGNDCTTTPPASYGRYPIGTQPTSLASLMAAAVPLTAKFGYQEISGFVDDIAGSPAPYIYATYSSVHAARAQLNGGATPLSFLKWNGSAFAAAGIGGADTSVLPAGPFQNCEAPAQSQYGSSINYVDETQQYLLTFVCVSAGDPALGQGNGGGQGGAWFFSTSNDLSDPTKWTAPKEIEGSWTPFDQSGGCPFWQGYYPTFMSLGAKPGHLSTSGYVFSLWGCQGGTPPPGRRMASRAFVITTSAPCTYSFNASGQSFPASGGTGNITVTAPANCPWTVGQLPSWITVTGASSGIGNGTVIYNVLAGSGGLSASITIGGAPFTIEQQGASIPGLSFIGSMPHIAAEENWTTAFTFVNKSNATATARLSLFGDPSDASGNGPLSLPLAFPQITPAPLPEIAASLDRSIATNASLVIDSAGPQTPPVQVGSAQLSATGAVDGFAIFHLIPGAQEAVVPMETRNASSYLLAFDNTGGVVLGVAVQNVSAQAGNVGVVIRDDTGAQIGSGTVSMAANSHTSFVLSSQYPVTANKRGTIEFDRPAGGQISVLGIRTKPLGSSNTLTTIPALANVGTNGGSIAHLATGNGWQT
ncbi:MAG TPA: BACON domain-containing protein, partial [Bryobacteraceae bacterium]|nr:BACON domain-containing protein [Bryobacteraceae bacterium]